MGYIYQYAPETLIDDKKENTSRVKRKLILFDIGGVLIDWTNVFQTASKEQNIPIEELNNTFDKYDKEITLGDITPQELYLKTLEEKNLRADTRYDFLDSWVRDYKSILPMYNFLLDIPNSFDIGLLSNIYDSIVPLLLKKNLIPDINYKYMFLSCDIKKQKPNEDIFEHVEQITGTKPGDIILVDDSKDNLLVAKERGWNTFLFDQSQPQESVEKLERYISL